MSDTDKTQDQPKEPVRGAAQAGSRADARRYLDLWERHLSLLATRGTAKDRE